MASENSEDAMMAAAIKASLEEAKKQSSQDRVVDLTKESDDEPDVQVVFPKSNSVVGSDTDNEADAAEGESDLNRAIALSLADTSPQVNKSPKKSPQRQDTDAQGSSSNQPTTQGIFGLDRKQMEEERLMRLSKRKASEVEASPERLPKAARISPSPGFEVLGSHHTSTATSSQTASDRKGNRPVNRNPRLGSPGYEVVNVKYFSPKPETQPAPTQPAPTQPTTTADVQRNAPSMVNFRPPSGAGIQWPSGIVKKTRLANSPRKHDDISIEEVLQKDDLELAVLSSFLWDMEWILGKLNTKETRILLVVHAANEERPAYEADAATVPNLRFCFPSLDGQINIMHSKLMLLFHSEYLRIVVPTANLIQVDWGAHSVMENTVFIIDLPLKAKTTGAKSSSGDTNDETYTQFYNDLVIFLKASSYPQGVIEKVAKFDFTKTARYAFVHSIGGSHTAETWRWTGYTGLGRAVSNLGLRTQSPVNVDFITSSLGALNEDLLRGIYLACKGDDGSTDYQFRNTKPAAKATSPLRGPCEEWQDRFRVYFPSQETVKAVARAAGRRPQDIGGTVCFGSKYWNSPKLPKRVLKDCQSQRDVLMHNKIAFVRPSESITLPDGSECRGWAYVGSANLSESAWGRLVKDRATGEPKLNCRNWECGVLVPVTSETSTTTKAKAASNSLESGSEHRELSLFNGTIPVPMKLPAESLRAEREPWFFMG
ncbi:hypothetical protein N7481_007359 [Penicillium waksmanii]|uniref:uncharacterized protein n=1 Tax=Penicillium waksmanii TaxID=69791 RepID=UPI00254730FC|nr:uncharacterized protein N7481_007359 [Penicillium waksmanii]KAJ5980061.1 hypothetical protein N7481_007359 [Penicillium waksmanii]